MDKDYNLCIIKPNKSTFSETFIQAHIDRLAGNKKVLYGGSFPVYDHYNKTLIKSGFSLLSYLFQKKILKRKSIKVRTIALKDYLMNQKIDVVLAEYGMVGGMVTDACDLANVPLVIHFHGADAHQYQTVNEYGTLYKQSFDYATAIVVVSNDMLQSLLSLGAPKDKLFLNPYGVDVNKFSQVGVTASSPYFLSVGRFVEKKAPLLILQAFKGLVDICPEAHLWMVGDGHLLPAAKQKTIDLGIDKNVTFTGVQTSSEIIELMKKMRGFIQHSVTALDGDMEGTPNTILEASSSGLPVISTRDAGIKEAVIDGITGLLCDEYDVEEMAKNIIAIAESKELAAQLGKAGRRHMIDNYDINKRIALLDDIIQDSINQHNKSN